MEKFMCYQKSQNGVLKVSCCSADELLVRHLNRNGINYYCTGEAGNSVELYYRLRNTGLKIRQNIHIGAFSYRCTTTVAEKPHASAEAQLKLMSQLCLINKRLIRGKFEYRAEDMQLQFVDRMSLHPKNKIVNIQNISERFDQLIGLPHYLMDVEYAEFLLDVMNKQGGKQHDSQQ